MRGVAAASRWRGRPWLPALASLLLHAGAAVAIAALNRADPPSAQPERGVEMVWQDVPEDAAPGEEAAASAATSDEAAPDASPRAEPEQEVAEAPPPPVSQQAEQPPPEPAPPPESALAEAPVPEVEPPPALAEQVRSPEVAEAPAPPEPVEARAAPPREEPPPELPLPPPAQPMRPAPPSPRQAAPPAQAASRQAPPGPSASAAAPSEAPGGSRATGAVSPPGLLDGFRNPEPEYPTTSRERGDQGVVTVQLRISEAGEVTAVEVIATSGHPALDDSARRAVRRWRFRPATRDGVAIPGSVRTAVHFRLQR